MTPKYSKMTLKDWFQGLDRNFKWALLDVHGVDPNFVAKKLFTYDYTINPTFNLKTAVSLDLASNGQVDFRDLVKGGNEVDWEFVRKLMTTRKREALKTAEVPAE